ncbi:hypothetical protein BGAL_0821g00010 [Botrytis galanthina]|uniref:Uncharacterized protein n=1 Tax=Botrytis galanthina TaxID=278940 RepID=A0A4S8QTA2_9HELO|nr:hypothetical protein BGAL_0821g00010 [Botrytis galanthina]
MSNRQYYSNYSSDERHADERYSDPRRSDPRHSDERHSDPRRSNPRHSDERRSDPRRSDPRHSDERRSDGRRSDGSSGGSNKAIYYGTSRDNTSSDDSKKRPSRGSGQTAQSGNTTQSGFSNFSQNPDRNLYGSSTNPQANPQSEEAYRRTQGVPRNPILYGETTGRSSTSTYPTNPEEHRDVYRDAVARGVPEDSQMRKLNKKYKDADENATQAKEVYREYRTEHAATTNDVKAERKALKEGRISEDERAFRGAPAGTRRFHEQALRLVNRAIKWADETDELRTEMSESYVATERSKKAADGHRKRATQMSQSAAKLRVNRTDHEKALDQFDQAEAAAQEAARAQFSRMAVQDEDDSDERTYTGKGKAKREGDSSQSRRRRY